MGRITNLLSQILEAQSEIWPTDPGRTHYLHVNATHRLCNVLQDCNQAKHSSFNSTYEVGSTCRNCCVVKGWKLHYLTGLWPTEDDGKNNVHFIFLCSLSTFFISSFIICSFVASLSVPSLLHLLLLKLLPFPLFSVPFTLSHTGLFLSSIAFLFRTFICSSYHNFTSRFLSMAQHTALLIRILAMAENCFCFPHILNKVSCKFPRGWF